MLFEDMVKAADQGSVSTFIILTTDFSFFSTVGQFKSENMFVRISIFQCICFSQVTLEEKAEIWKFITRSFCCVLVPISASIHNQLYFFTNFIQNTSRRQLQPYLKISS